MQVLTPDLKIRLYKEYENISSWRLFGNKTVHYINAYFASGKTQFGSLLIDFLETNFEEQHQFDSFVDNWGLAGLMAYSPIVQEIWNQQSEVNTEEYTRIMLAARVESLPHLIEVQKAFNMTVYDCLFNEGPNWTKGLTPTQRFYLISNSSEGELEIKKYATTLRYNYDVCSDFGDSGYLISDMFKEDDCANLLRHYNFNPTEEFSADNIAAICLVEFKEMVNNNYVIKRCKNCGRYFVPTKRINTEYCDRVNKVSSNGVVKTCKEIGPLISYTNKTVKDPLIDIYRKAYKLMHSRKTKGKHKITEDEFKAWTSCALMKIDDVRKGKLTLEEFQLWVNETKSKKII